jgi:hypothetical protein
VAGARVAWARVAGGRVAGGREAGGRVAGGRVAGAKEVVAVLLAASAPALSLAEQRAALEGEGWACRTGSMQHRLTTSGRTPLQGTVVVS